MDIKTVAGPDIRPYLDDLARLRITVFREFPYLYDGSAEYEAEYLKAYTEAAASCIVLALDGEQVVGASTGIPLAKAGTEIREPWLSQPEAPEQIFYFGESVLLSGYRGQGIGKRFFNEREAWAQRLGGYSLLTFCAVIRPVDHPQRPPEYVALDRFWDNRGFQKRAGCVCRMSWKEVTEATELMHTLQFWTKAV
ncbi:MAG: N-acetyltransferase [Bacteroidetes bacterium]|nr:MAG: N-acetyltransferase [Bacteroidota bacterium]